MPASTRTHVARPTSSRPYDRRSPTASPTQSRRASPVQDPDVPPDHPGLPTYAEYKRIEAGYLHGLSPRKRDKALITQAMFDKIWDVLHQPEACTIETPQFRFWVRKMFTLTRLPRAEMMTTAMGDADDFGGEWGGDDPTTTNLPYAPDSNADRRGRDEGEDEDEEADLALERAMGIGRGTEADAAALLHSAVVLHENRPVAIMEQLYELFCYCHVRAGHGGRDKTCAVIREHYSWVPKELTAQFVKACPTCTLKRSGAGDLGVALQRRVLPSVAKERRRGRRSVVKEAPTTEGPPALRWPTTGGPLDPANPPPCGVREREQMRNACGEADPSLRSPPTPKEVFVESGLLNGWSGVSQVQTAPPSPLHACDPVFSFGTSLFRHTFSIDEALAAASVHQDAPRPCSSPRGGAFSNDFLDASGPRVASKAGDARRRSTHAVARGAFGLCSSPSPPATSPLCRPSSPPSHGATAVERERASSSSEDAAAQFQIDPVLLSFACPGLGCRASSGGASGLGLVLDLAGVGAPSASASEAKGNLNRAASGQGQDGARLRLRLRRAWEGNNNGGGCGAMPGVPALHTSTSTSTSSDSPDSSFERASVATATATATVTAAESAMFLRPPSSSSPSPSRYRCGYSARDDGTGLGSMLLLQPLSCRAADLGSVGFGIGQDQDQDLIDLDGTPLSRFSILADA